MSASLDARAAPPSATPSARRWPVAPWEIAVVVGAVLTVALIGALALSKGVPLLWDESVYGLRTRFNLGLGEAVSTRGDYWLDVRAPGLPLLLTPTAALFGSSDLALRITCLLFAMVATGLTWYIARLLTDATTAAIAVWLVVIFPGWHVSSWQMMPDIPGAAITLAAMAIILAAGRGDRLSWWALLAVP
ncbi:MAG TPA: glycosyltransferase family 39 protein, partial [Euzebyales bacterium]